jgi:hypothetical protein
MARFHQVWLALLVAAASVQALAGEPPSKADQQPTQGKSPDRPTASKPTTAKTTAAKPGAAKANARPLPPLSAEREAAAVAFAREHHPELAALIGKLRADNRRDYDRAIRELSAACERLTRLKKAAPDQYALALAGWKLDSRAQLLAARMTISQTPGLEADLKQVLAERADVRLKEFKAERARLEDRVTKLNASIQSLETDKNAVVEKDLLRIKRSVARNRRPATKPAGKTSQPAVASQGPVTEPPKPPAVPTTASVRPPADASHAPRSNEKQQ